MSDLVTFTHQIAVSLHRVGLAGAAVDLAKFKELGTEWQQSAARLHDKLMKQALAAGMKEFAATNDTMIRELIYKRYKFPIMDLTESRLPAVSKPTLKKLIREHGKQRGGQFLTDLIEFNKVDKLASTWYGRDDGKADNRKASVGQLIQAVPGKGKAARDDLGLLHFWIYPLRARTGRRASGGGEEGDPESRNSQNWPPAARNSIVSRWRGWRGKPGNVVICDFAKLEVVIIAWLAGDEKLLHYFTKGGGYIGVAKEFWGQDVVDGSPMYKATKTIVLGLNYEMGTWTLANRLWWADDPFKFSEDWDEHVKITDQKRKQYFRMFRPLRRYMRARGRELLATQQVVSPSGRVRHLPHHGAESEGYWHLKNSAVNFPIQSFASDVTGGAIVDYEYNMLKDRGLSYNDWHSALLDRPFDPPASPVFNEVHDELDLDLHPRTGKRDLEILVDCMENVRTLKKLVPALPRDFKFKVDIQKVERWGEAH